jgi:hypothetical protein
MGWKTEIVEDYGNSQYFGKEERGKLTLSPSHLPCERGRMLIEQCGYRKLSSCWHWRCRVTRLKYRRNVKPAAGNKIENNEVVRVPDVWFESILHQPKLFLQLHSEILPHLFHCVLSIVKRPEVLRMTAATPWLPSNTLIRKCIQRPTVKEEICHCSSQYSARLSAHTNELVVNFLAQIHK